MRVSHLQRQEVQRSRRLNLEHLSEDDGAVVALLKSKRLTDLDQ